MIERREKGAGAVSVRGLGRFPVTLHQWLKLLDMGEDIRAFIRTKGA